MYFETGQGSALSANAHHGVDQQTLEARAYATCRPFKPLLVNTACCTTFSSCRILPGQENDSKERNVSGEMAKIRLPNRVP